MKTRDEEKIPMESMDGCAKGLVTMIVFVLLITGLAGCKTVQTEYVYKTDTLLVHKTDTVKETQIKYQRYDSLVHDSVTVTRDVEGNPVEIDRWHIIKVKDYQRDSVDKYKAICDSLKAVNNKLRQKKEVVTKTDYTGWWAFGGLLLLIACVILMGYAIHKRQ